MKRFLLILFALVLVLSPVARAGYDPFGNLLFKIGPMANAILNPARQPIQETCQRNSIWRMDRQNLRHTGKLEKPSLNQPKKRADAGFEFEMFGEVGQPYTIQSSTNLASWAVVTNFIASTQTTSVVDFTASNSPSRFYRALIQ